MEILTEWLFRPATDLMRMLCRLRGLKYRIYHANEHQRQTLEAIHSKDLERFLAVQNEMLIILLYSELGRWNLADDLRHEMAIRIAHSLLTRAFFDMNGMVEQGYGATARDYVAAQQEKGA